MAAWAAKYGAAGTASTSAIATIVNDHANAAGTFVIQSLQKDSGGNGLAVSVQVTDKTQASGNATRSSGNIGYMIGTTALLITQLLLPLLVEVYLLHLRVN